MDEFTTIVVPIDGSVSADTILPYAATLARLEGAEIVLLRVLDYNHPIYLASSYHLSDDDERGSQLDLPLDELLEPEATRLQAAGLTVHPVIRFGDPSVEIRDEAEKYLRPIIALASHGRGGVSRAVLGSVAASVARTSRQPVFIVRVMNRPIEVDSIPFRRISVLLDGSPLAEAAIEPAITIARPAGATIELVQVAETYRDELPPHPPSKWFFPSYPAVTRRFERIEAAADDYLREIATRLQQDGLTLTRHVLSGDPSRQLLIYLNNAPPDLVVMTSHGRGGVKRLLMGSVADKILTGSQTPLLLIHNPETIMPQLQRELREADSGMATSG